MLVGTKIDLRGDEELKKKILEQPGERIVEDEDVFLILFFYSQKEYVKNWIVLIM